MCSRDRRRLSPPPPLPRTPQRRRRRGRAVCTPRPQTAAGSPTRRQACIGDPRAGYLAHLRAMHAYGVLFALLWIFDGLVFGTMGLVERDGTPLGCLQPLEEAAEREDREVALKDARAASAAAAAASGGGGAARARAARDAQPGVGPLAAAERRPGVHANSGWAMLILSLIPPARRGVWRPADA